MIVIEQLGKQKKREESDVRYSKTPKTLQQLHTYLPYLYIHHNARSYLAALKRIAATAAEYRFTVE